jgi:hypothetical protein
MTEIITGKKYMITIKDVNVTSKICSEHPDYYSKIITQNFLKNFSKFKN